MCRSLFSSGLSTSLTNISDVTVSCVLNDNSEIDNFSNIQIPDNFKHLQNTSTEELNFILPI